MPGGGAEVEDATADGHRPSTLLRDPQIRRSVGPHRVEDADSGPVATRSVNGDS